ncbi:heavy metal-binding domain-containing protein [Hyphococcus sp.]|jgi:Ni,Fe-hydrogenase III large subunit/DNA-directed RNA polymerase subunit M/transcription elongation factor TFIIS|uniref:heavy metal-binding domain-containing protein n=1 Tax=Hyphococcus sp. TaxID=2038636 RepID=UPI003D0FF73B
MSFEGARQGACSPLRRLVAAALARDLQVFVAPGVEVARAYGLDFAAAGLKIAATPRHSSVLLVTGPLPRVLRDAASVVYAQMPRPRAILALGSNDLAPLPGADVVGALNQTGLLDSIADLRRFISRNAFSHHVCDFDAPALKVSLKYTCPMHAEVVTDVPGSCPKCGMTLVPREKSATPEHRHAAHRRQEAQMRDVKQHTRPAAARHHHTHTEKNAVQYACPMHPEVVSDKPGSCPKCGMHLVPVEEEPSAAHDSHDHGDHGQQGDGDGEHAQYTCPMHPEVVSDKPGSCPKCGMHLVPVQKAGAAHDSHDHGHGGHGDSRIATGIEPHFMSMVEITKNLPESADGLRMDWIETPFGPFFPGLPGGLTLSLTLDGDTVANSKVGSFVAGGDALGGGPVTPEAFVSALAKCSPLTPIAFHLLACAAIEDAVEIVVPFEAARGRVGALERERIASHLNWLSQFCAQTGLARLSSRAAKLQLAVQGADIERIEKEAGRITRLLKALAHAPLLKARLSGIGKLSDATPDLDGPVGRATGKTCDARAYDPVYAALGFIPASRPRGDALDRFNLKLDEIAQSLALITAAGRIAPPVLTGLGPGPNRISGCGRAIVETPRGPARLRLRLENGMAVSAELDAPSSRHSLLVDRITHQHELGDALVAISSLDLSPWDMRR